MARGDVRLAEVIGALTYALDLTEGQRPGHTQRTTLIAMRLAGELGLDADTRGALYYAALLKDSGCSSNAARMAALFGSDDQELKRSMRLVDWHDKFRLAMRTAKNCGVGLNPFSRGIGGLATGCRLLRVVCAAGPWSDSRRHLFGSAPAVPN